MKLFLHQWRWDFRRVGLLWALWLGLSVLSSYLRFSILTSAAERSPLQGLSITFEIIVNFVLAPCLVLLLLSTTPFSGSAEGWKTRPVSRRTLFWEKSLFGLMMIWLPVVLIRWVQYAGIDGSADFLVRAVSFYGCLTLVVYLMTAIIMALSERASVAIGMVLAGISGLMALNVAPRLVAVKPLITIGEGEVDFYSRDTLHLAIVVVLFGALAGWVCGVRFRHRVTGLALLGFGMLIFGCQGSLWWVQLHERRQIPDRQLDFAVLGRTEEPIAGQRLVYPQLSAELSSHQVIWNESSLLTLSRSDGQGDLRRRSKGPDFSPLTDPMGAEGIKLSVVTKIGEPLIPLGNDELNGMVTRLKGSYTGKVVELSKVGVLPFDVSSSRSFPGFGLVRVMSTAERDGRLAGFEVRFIHTRRQGPSSHEDMTGACLVVLRDSSSGEGLVVGDSGRNFRSGPRLQSVECRIEPTDWQEFSKLRRSSEAVGDLELVIFELKEVAKVQGSYERDPWIAYLDRRGGAEELVRPEEMLELSSEPDELEVNAFLDGLFAAIPKRFRQGQREVFVEKFDEVGRGHLDLLIERLPVGHYARDLVYRAIRKNVASENLPALLEVVARDPDLTGILREKGWLDEAFEAVRPLLKERKSPLPWSAVVIVAKRNDPASYEDMFWHFVRAESGHRYMYERLAECAEFPLDEAVREAWKLNRLELGGGGSDASLAMQMMRLGDKEALRVVTDRLMRDQDDRELKLFDQAVKQGDGEEPLVWVRENFNKLEFDQASRCFQLVN